MSFSCRPLPRFTLQFSLLWPYGLESLLLHGLPSWRVQGLQPPTTSSGTSKGLSFDAAPSVTLRSKRCAAHIPFGTCPYASLQMHSGPVAFQFFCVLLHKALSHV